MAKVDDFATAVEARLEAADNQIQKARTGLSILMYQNEQYELLFEKLSKMLLEDVIATRLHKLATYLDNADIYMDLPSQQCGCRFKRTNTFCACANLNFHLQRDPALQQATLNYCAQIQPDLLEYERQSSFAITLDDIDTTPVETWVDQKLLGFVDTYLEVRVSEHYETFSQVVDPVCKMRINRIVALPLEHDSKTFYFCAESCRDAFKKEPGRYLAEILPVEAVKGPDAT